MMKLLSSVSFASLAMARALPQSGQAFAQYKSSPMAAAEVLYTMDNKGTGNSVIAFPVAADGTIAMQGPSYPTNGMGARTTDFFNGTAGGEKDALDSQNSMTIAGNLLFVANAASNTVTTFSIDCKDPTKLTMVGAPAPSIGDFPNSIAASAKLKIACVGNTGPKPGVACYKITKDGLVPQDQSVRPVQLTPQQSALPVGPINTMGHVLFDYDLKGVFGVAKGNPETTPKAPDHLYYWPIVDGAVSRDGSVSSPNSTALIFGSYALPNNRLFTTDASFGAVLLDIDASGKATTVYKHNAAPNQGASCWSMQVPSTGQLFVTADTNNTIDAYDGQTGYYIKSTNFTNGNPSLSEMGAAADKLYALSYGNLSYPQHILTSRVSGLGDLTQLQNFQVSNANTDISGLAVMKDKYGYEVDDACSIDFDSYWGS